MAKKKPFDELCAMREKVYDEVHEESDRGLVLVAGDYLSNLLEGLLRQVFVDIPEKGVLDDLFRESGPLGSFAVRTRICYLMGLLGTDTYRALNLIREIRNTAAHSIEPFSLASPDLREKCVQLTTREGSQDHKVEEWPARKRFLHTFWWVLIEIMLRTGRRRHARIGAEFHIPFDELPTDVEAGD